jgi:hypothetical protein
MTRAVQKQHVTLVPEAAAVKAKQTTTVRNAIMLAEKFTDANDDLATFEGGEFTLTCLGSSQIEP